MLVAGELASSSSAPMKPCRTSTAVVEAMVEAGQVVPRACIQAIREAELEESVQECLHSAVQHAPHRTVYDPAAKRPGTPTTSRKFVSYISYMLCCASLCVVMLDSVRHVLDITELHILMPIHCTVLRVPATLLPMFVDVFGSC